MPSPISQVLPLISLNNALITSHRGLAVWIPSSICFSLSPVVSFHASKKNHNNHNNYLFSPNTKTCCKQSGTITSLGTKVYIYKVLQDIKAKIIPWRQMFKMTRPGKLAALKKNRLPFRLQQFKSNHCIFYHVSLIPTVLE